jgi:hypothetical protein
MEESNKEFFRNLKIETRRTKNRKMFINPFYSHFARQPTLALDSLISLIKKQRKSYENKIEDIRNNSNTVVKIKTKQITPQLYIFENSDNVKKNKLPVMPTCILYAIHVANTYGSNLDLMILSSAVANRAGSSREKLKSPKASILHYIISIVQFKLAT